MIYIDVKKVIETRIAESMGFDKYKQIMEIVWKTNVSSDLDFQRTFTELQNLEAAHIIEYLKQYGKARKSDFRKLLIDKLPGSLSDNQKESKIGNLLTSLRKQGVIKTDPDDRLYWILA